MITITMMFFGNMPLSNISSRRNSPFRGYWYDGNALLNKNVPSLGGFEPPTFRLTAERANRLRHRDLLAV